MFSPLVSVLMTAFNREKYIAEAIESVLESTYKNWELIIVDDLSNDRTVEIARSYQAKDRRVKVYVNEKNLGDYPNRNKAASFAKGDYITYVDSDDMIYPYTLSLMIEAASKHKDCALFFDLRDHDKDVEANNYLSSEQAIRKHFLDDGFLETGPLGTMILKSAFDEVNGFSGKRMIGDLELWLKIASLYPVYRMEKKMVYWRKHDSQESNDGADYYITASTQLYRDFLINCSINSFSVKQGKIIYKKIKLQRIRQSIMFFFRKRDKKFLKFAYNLIFEM